MVNMRKSITISLPNKDADFIRQNNISPSKIVQKVTDWFRTRDGIAMLRIEDVQKKPTSTKSILEGRVPHETIME